MAATRRILWYNDPLKGNPFVNISIWTLMWGALGTIYGLSDPAGGLWIYSLVAGAFGFAFGCYTQISNGAVAEALRLPQGFRTVLNMISSNGR